LDDQRKDAAREAFILKRTSEAFGKDGIQALIIENAIPEIQDDANSILRRLTHNSMQISLESQRERQSGGTRETLDIKISDERGTREYSLFSGGEAFRADFALRIALSKLLARRAGTQLRTLIIDEGFGTQDSDGLQQMIECIQAIAEDFSKVLVVTHLDAIKNAFRRASKSPKSRTPARVTKCCWAKIARGVALNI
jgi:exonuclease SbcC